MDSTRESLAGRNVGNWRLIRLLGEGAFGAVYEAENITIDGRRAAVKILHPEMSVHASVKQRFLNEASAASRADHENIVQIFDGGITDDGICYSVMELLRGAALSDLLQKDTRLPVARAVGLCIQIARALEAAHAINVVHRDLKPDNIFVVQRPSSGDFIKVLDFGVAKLRGEIHGAAGQSMTGAGMMIGTPGYMSPEQWMTMPDVDGRADIYALGIILFECLTGRLPYSASTPYEWLTAHLEQPLPDLHQLATVPEEVAAVVRAMTAKKREDRPQTMDEVALRLERAIANVAPQARADRRDQTPITPVRLSTADVAPPTPKRSLGPVFGGIALAVAAIVVVLGYVESRSKTTAKPAAAVEPHPAVAAPDPKKQVAALVEKASTAKGDIALALLDEALAIDPADEAALEAKKRIERLRRVERLSAPCRVGMVSGKWELAYLSCHEVINDWEYMTRYPGDRARLRSGLVNSQLAELNKSVAKKDCAQVERIVRQIWTIDEPSPEIEKYATACNLTRGQAATPTSPEVEKKLAEAQDAYVHGDYKKAIAIATPLTTQSVKAWRVIGSSHCFLKDKANARQAADKLDNNGKNLLKYVCSRNDIQID